MKLIVYIFLINIIMSCNHKDHEVIEFYLLKNRKKNIEGFELKDVQNYIKKNDINLSEFSEPSTFDTISNKMIFASNFEYSIDDLESKAFIADQDILSLNTKKGTIKFSNNGARKIFDINPNFRNGEQFVITINKVPVLNGYFYNPYSSNGSIWNTIQYDDFKKIKNSKLKYYEFSFFIGDGTSNKLGRSNIDFDKYPILIKTLRDTDRLIE
nr:hypothetical protein [uncultured Flavobacterium sp.]